MSSESAQTAKSNGTTQLTDQVARKAHDTIDGAAKISAGAEARVREQAEVAADKIKDTEERAREAARQSVDDMSGYIKSNPLTSAGIAFAAGIVISSLLRR